MLEKAITYTDYRGKQQTETFGFNLNKPELVELALGYRGGLEEYIRDLIKADDQASIMKAFKQIIKMSVGQISEDGRRFEKSESITNDFMQSEAYPELFMELIQDANAAAEFIKAIVPEDIARQAEESEEKYSEKELLRMSDAEFDRVVGSKEPKNMSKLELQVSMYRRNNRNKAA